MPEVSEAILEGDGSVDSSTGMESYGRNTMVDTLVSGKHDIVIATHMQSGAFQKDDQYLDVTRDTEDTIIHTHGRRVLLMRSGEKVPDDTLICPQMEHGLVAFGKAAEELDTLQIIKRSDLGNDPEARKAHTELETGFQHMVDGLQPQRSAYLFSGNTKIRAWVENESHRLSGELKYAIYRTIIRGQQNIPKQYYRVVKWDEEGIDELLMEHGTGHCRSLLDIDLASATEEELERALGGLEIEVERGLHYELFMVSREEDAK